MKNFWSGFEKRAYDYNQEARELKDNYKSISKESPMSKTHASVTGGVLGAGVGALAGISSGLATHQPIKSLAGGAGLGGVAGAAIGIMLGLAAAHGHKESINEAKKILKMAPKNQMDFLKSKARGNEAHENRHEQARLNAQYHNLYNRKDK